MFTTTQHWPVYPIQRAPTLGIPLSAGLIAFLVYWATAQAWLPSLVALLLILGGRGYYLWRRGQYTAPLWLCYQAQMWQLSHHQPEVTANTTLIAGADVVIIHKIWQTPFFYTLALSSADQRIKYPTVVCWRHHLKHDKWWQLALRLRSTQGSGPVLKQPQREHS